MFFHIVRSNVSQPLVNLFHTDRAVTALGVRLYDIYTSFKFIIPEKSKTKAASTIGRFFSAMETVKLTSIEECLAQIKLEPNEQSDSVQCIEVKAEHIEMNRIELEHYIQRQYDFVFNICSDLFHSVRIFLSFII